MGFFSFNERLGNFNRLIFFISCLLPTTTFFSANWRIILRDYFPKVVGSRPIIVYFLFSPTIFPMESRAKVFSRPTPMLRALIALFTALLCARLTLHKIQAPSIYVHEKKSANRLFKRFGKILEGFHLRIVVRVHRVKMTQCVRVEFYRVFS